MRNVLLTIAYDGSNFAGWQRQKSARTVSGELEKVFFQLCGEGIKLEGAGRTDAGVHALGMCATLRGEFGIPAERVPTAANDLLAGSRINRAGEIRILAAEEMPEHFHARFDAKARTYLYRIISSPEIDIFKRNYAYQVQSPLDIPAMREAAVFLAGTSDYTSFMSRGGNGEDDAVRTVSALEIEFRPAMYEGSDAAASAGAVESGGEFGAVFGREGEISARGESGAEVALESPEGESGAEVAGESPARRESDREKAVEAPERKPARMYGDVDIRITADGFLYNMVRIIAGTLVEVGDGRRTPESVRDSLLAGDRAASGHRAPPGGLYLEKIYY